MTILNMKPLNPHLKTLDPDYLYHLGLDSSMDLKSLFGDVKFVCMGGSRHRAKNFAKKAADFLGLELQDDELQPLGKMERCLLYKVGPVISVSHGMGMPSISIFLHELTKLLHYAEAKDFAFIRIGTSGGVGVAPGTVVVTTEAVNEKLEPVHEKVILGQVNRYPTKLDANLIDSILSAKESLNVETGKTMGTHDFYEGQGRLDGALTSDYSDADKMAFLQKAHALGVKNIEMECSEFAAFCARAGIPGAVVCASIVNRLNGDQITSTPEELAQFSDNAQQLILNYIKQNQF